MEMHEFIENVKITLEKLSANITAENKKDIHILRRDGKRGVVEILLQI